MFLVVGEVQGERRRRGVLDNGSPWEVHEMSLLASGDFEATIVRLRDFEGEVPRAGDAVVLEAVVQSGKVNALRRRVDVEAAVYGS